MNERFYLWRRAWLRAGIWNILLRFWFKMYVDGWENIPASGPVLLMGNHVAAFDPVLTVGFFPDRDIVPMAKIEAFSQPVMRFFVRHWDAIPVRRGEGDMQAMRDTLRHLNEGGVTMLYPEGTRSETGLIEGQEGSAYLALKSRAVVVPVAIWGTRVLWRAWFSDFRRVSVFVRFGKPFRFRHGEQKVSRELLRAMTDEAMYRISALLPTAWRGIYHDLSQATTRYLDLGIDWEPVHTPLPRWCTTEIPAAQLALT